ncbi:amidase [Acidicapsa ligni]|uniref:amidase n=1 Tax=Acidicapsa ligni TaxID=542300 RepID=UPI0021DFA6E4|nr:amidase family protein [Acidicapsa ligni]
MGLKQNFVRSLRATLASAANPSAEIQANTQSSLALSNGNPSHNTYLWQDAAWTLKETDRISSAAYAEHGMCAKPGLFGDARPSLWGVPISVKDCFDLAGSPTTCGTNFYRELHGIATHDSWLVEQLRSAGAIIIGKTHLHPLAYGITGENAEFGDCLQPGDAGALTGGSSSGAAASVMEGSALASIGTDTGGSVRVPSALCGLAGYRASLGRGDWRGAAHLAQSFDTLGWLFHDLEDGPLLGSIFGSTDASKLTLPKNFAVISNSFLHDCEAAVVASLKATTRELEELGLTATTVDIDWWSDSLEIFAAIQASEAATIHRGNYAAFMPSIRERLQWGASLGDQDIAALRMRHAAFRDRMDALLAKHELLLMPAAPVTRLVAGADHSQTRTRLLRYTTPASLSGMPTVTVPCFASGHDTAKVKAGGVQLVAAHEDDARLLTVAAQLGARRAAI